MKGKLQRVPVSKLRLEELNLLNEDFKILFERGDDFFKVKNGHEHRREKSVLRKFVIVV